MNSLYMHVLYCDYFYHKKNDSGQLYMSLFKACDLIFTRYLRCLMYMNMK